MPFWVARGEYTFLRLSLVEAASFAKPHGVLGAVELYRLAALVIFLVDGVSEEVNRLSLDDGEKREGIIGRTGRKLHLT